MRNPTFGHPGTHIDDELIKRLGIFAATSLIGMSLGMFWFVGPVALEITENVIEDRNKKRAEKYRESDAGKADDAAADAKAVEDAYARRAKRLKMCEKMRTNDNVRKFVMRRAAKIDGYATDGFILDDIKSCGFGALDDGFVKKLNREIGLV